MTKEYNFHFQADIHSVFSAFSSAITSKKNTIHNSTPPQSISFGVKFSLKYNMNGGDCTLTFTPQGNGTSVHFSIFIVQLAAARCQAYAKDLCENVSRILNIAPVQLEAGAAHSPSPAALNTAPAAPPYQAPPVQPTDYYQPFQPAAEAVYQAPPAEPVYSAAPVQPADYYQPFQPAAEAVYQAPPAEPIYSAAPVQPADYYQPFQSAAEAVYQAPPAEPVYSAAPVQPADYYQPFQPAAEPVYQAPPAEPVYSAAPVQPTSASTIICPNCGKSTAGSNLFCTNCGTQINPKGSICSKCGNETAPTDLFCIECGNKLR